MITVIFTNECSYLIERENAAKIMNVGQTYECIGAYVHRSSTDIILKGVPGEYNSCLFDLDFDEIEQLAIEQNTHCNYNNGVMYD